jgi:GNAT superfamily N-acetyltransferase
MTLVVRPARHGDEARLAKVYVASGRAAWAGNMLEETLAAFTSPVEEWEEAISDPDVSILVAELGGEIAALATLLPSKDPDADPGEVAMLGRLYAESAAWGKGLGRVLLAACMEELKRRGFREATLWTAEWNRTRGFYEAHGWHWDGATREQTLAGESWTEVRYRIEVSRGRESAPQTS